MNPKPVQAHHLIFFCALVIFGAVSITILAHGIDPVPLGVECRSPDHSGDVLYIGRSEC